MSEPNTTAATTTPVAPTKPGKSKGLSIFNRVAFIVAALLAVLTIAMLVATAVTSKSATNMRDEAQATREQAGQELASYWCSQNVAKFDELRDLYLGVSETAQSAVDQQCRNKVTINNLVATNDTNGAFDTTSECTINASGTKITCTATVTANDTIKKDLASFSSTTVTLQMSMQTTSSKLTSKGHDIGEVATVNVDRSGTGKTQFTVPYDPTWGEYYKVDVKSFFPNE